jgi:hypothetical protein
MKIVNVHQLMRRVTLLGKAREQLVPLLKAVVDAAIEGTQMRGLPSVLVPISRNAFSQVLNIDYDSMATYSDIDENRSACGS